ncbi:MAG: hypothetical protein KDN05_02280 [Verrucomicrobiae bacterium]|nr:hypothetical protein [Verrucomicrobiae bacterium]
MVVLGPNNTCKTTILRAIDFLFYGSLGGESQDTAWKLVTDIVRDETKVGTEVEAWVDARMRLQNDEVRTVRTVAGKLKSGQACASFLFFGLAKVFALKCSYSDWCYA